MPAANALPAPRDAEGELSLDALRRFLLDPAGQFLRQRLDIRLAEIEDAGEDIEPLQAPGHGLQRNRLQRAAFDALLAGDDEASLQASLRARAVAVGAAGRRAGRDRARSAAVCRCVRALAPRRRIPRRCRSKSTSTGCACTAASATPGRRASRACASAKPNGPSSIRNGLDWLLARAAGVGMPFVEFHETEGHGIGPHPREAIAPEQAIEALRGLLALRREGLRRPLPFAPQRLGILRRRRQRARPAQLRTAGAAASGWAGRRRRCIAAGLCARAIRSPTRRRPTSSRARRHRVRRGGGTACPRRSSSAKRPCLGTTRRTRHERARDPYLDLPLHGLRLIEASAGTGKTFTLATLATRLVLERGLRVGDILAVTYTEAATQELRRRIRERPQLALEPGRCAAGESRKRGSDPDPAAAEARLARGDEDAGALRRRLRRAVLDVDLAAVFTIHGFCARVLREHALEAGQGFDAPELLADETGLREEVAADLWRAHARDDAGADDLAALWKGGYEELAKDLPALLRERVLLPPDAPLPPDPAASLQAAADALVRAIDAHSDDAQAQVAKAFDAKVFDGRRARHASFDKAFDELRAGRTDRQWPRTDKTHLQSSCRRNCWITARTGNRRTCRCPRCSTRSKPGARPTRQRRHGSPAAASPLLHRLRDDARVRLARGSSASAGCRPTTT